MVTQNWVIIGSGNGLVTDGIKQLRELTKVKWCGNKLFEYNGLENIYVSISVNIP